MYSWQRWLATQCLSSSYFLFCFLFFSHCVVVCCKKQPHFVLLVGKCGRMLLLLMIEPNRTHVINANETLKKETKREKKVKGRREVGGGEKGKATLQQLPFARMAIHNQTLPPPPIPSTHTLLCHGGGSALLPRKLRPLLRRMLTAIDPSRSSGTSRGANAMCFSFTWSEGGSSGQRAEKLSKDVNGEVLLQKAKGCGGIFFESFFTFFQIS